MTTTVLALVGSLRSASVNRRIADLARDLAPEGVEVRVAEGLDQLPFYNEDLDGEELPESVVRVRGDVAAADALLLVTPEYNGGLPGVLKNAIDWLSRPFGNGAIKGKPVAVLGTAAGRFGGTWAHQDSLKSVKIAGALPHEEPAGSFAISQWSDSREPADQPEVVEAVRTTLATLAHDVQEASSAA